MKSLLLKVIIPLALMAGCYSETKITGSWRSPNQPSKQYQTIFLAALSGNTITKAMLESEMESALKKQGVTIIKSIDEFPPNFEKDSIPRSELMKRVKKKGSDAILTISVLKRETESRYVSGGYYPMTWGYYGNFWGYYNYWYPYVYNDGYYSRNTVYYLETNLYDSNTEALVWSAQSKTYDYDYQTQFTKEFATLMVNQMKKDGIIPAVIKSGNYAVRDSFQR